MVGAFLVTGLLAGLAYALRMISRSGALGGFVVGAVIYLCLGPPGFVVLALFVVGGSALTRLGYRSKHRRGVRGRATRPQHSASHRHPPKSPARHRWRCLRDGDARRARRRRAHGPSGADARARDGIGRGAARGAGGLPGDRGGQLRRGPRAARRKRAYERSLHTRRRGTGSLPSIVRRYHFKDTKQT